jgi:small-conductance mechanosensitive channel/CRP-like cAMP-binding protein
MIVGLALVLTTLILRGATGNRHVRGRLLASSIAFGAYALIGVALSYLSISTGLGPRLRATQPLLLSFGALNALVALAVNPWRTDRLPDRFPTIVQDSIVIALFALAATFILQERIFATTAVGAVILGFALQDTLGNLFAGLAIQIEKPFRVGHWVSVADKNGQVSEITWRATKIRTKSGNFIIVPNSVLSRDTITNYSQPFLETRVELDIGASYDTPPNQVKSTILEAIKDDPLFIKTPRPEVLLWDFADSSITYRIRVWTTDYAAEDHIRDRIRTAVYYAFRRTAITIPYPTSVQMFREDPAAKPREPAIVENALQAVQIFAALSEAERAELGRAARLVLYAVGEPIVREGDAGSSMFVVIHGDVVVTVGPAAHEVARLGPGDVFGEMSLLTGAPRAATVAAFTDAELLEITADAFRRFVLANPTTVEQIGGAVQARAATLEEHRAAGAAAAPPVEAPHTFLARVRRFLRLAGV